MRIIIYSTPANCGFLAGTLEVYSDKLTFIGKKKTIEYQFIDMTKASHSMGCLDITLKSGKTDDFNISDKKLRLEIIDYINQLKQEQGIDYIKVKFRYPITGYNKTVINNYYRTNPYVTPDFSETKKDELKKQEVLDDQNIQYSYLMDKDMNDFDRFVKYVNDNEGCEFITVQKLNELLSEAI